MGKPKVLLVDVETAPKESLHFQVWNVNIPHNQVKKDTSILSWAAKWEDKPTIYMESNRGKRDPRDDKKLLKGIYSLINEADIFVAHNGDKFDMRQLRTRFIKHDMVPNRKPKQIDTLKIARKEFGFTFNKLEYLAKFLKLPVRKLTNREFQGFDLWDAVLERNDAAWDEMERYNKRDVEVLERVYHKLMPWAGYDFSVFNKGQELCSCGSTEFVNNGFGARHKTLYQRRRCANCGNELKR
jgi:hypothetical protein